MQEHCGERGEGSQRSGEGTSKVVVVQEKQIKTIDITITDNERCSLRNRATSVW